MANREPRSNQVRNLADPTGCAKADALQGGVVVSGRLPREASTSILMEDEILSMENIDSVHLKETLRICEIAGRFRRILQDVPSVAVQGYGPDGTVHFWNSASEQLYGYSRQEAMGRNLVDLIIPPEMRNEVQQAIRRMADTGQPLPASELPVMRKDGSCITVYSIYSVLQIPGGKQQLFSIDVDLTERRQAEEALQRHIDRLQEANSDLEGENKDLTWLWEESQKLAVVLKATNQQLYRQTDALTALNTLIDTEMKSLASVMEALPTGVAIVDTKGGIIQANKAYEQIWGTPIPVTQSIEDYAAFKAWWDETDQLVAPDEWASARAIQKGETSVGQVLRIQRFDGSEVVVINGASPVYDGKGIIAGCVVAIQDVSELKRIEAALRASNERHRVLAETMLQGVVHQDAEGRVIAMNPAAERILGKNSEQFMGSSSVMEAHHTIRQNNEPFPAAEHPSIVALRTGQPVRGAIMGVFNPQLGKHRWISIDAVPVFPLGATRASEVFAVFEDVTDREYYKKGLEKMVTMRTVDFVAALEEAEKRKEQAETDLREIKKLHEQLEAERGYLQAEIKLEHNFTKIIGQSDGLKNVLYKVEQIAGSDTTVLILGETGTGKELIARAVHDSSLRKNRTLVKVNCAALPANLIESELFGHEKGSFTGSLAKHLGRFEVANGGTFFLDEIGELPIELQGKLLRVLQEGEFERVGSSRTIKVDTRIIAATNRNLEEEVRQGRFREDLWYRLNIFPITTPPLRERQDDIPLLVDFYVKKIAKRMGKTIDIIPARMMDALQQYHWPGNIRELENVLERAVINSSGPKLCLADELKRPAHVLCIPTKTLASVERDYILQVLEETNWKVSGANSASEILGLDRSTLRARMAKLNIEKS